MVGLLLLVFISVATSQEDDTALRHQIDQLASQLLSLQEREWQKESYILELDEVISDMQRQLQGIKTAELAAMLKQNEEELFNLRRKIQSLLSDIDRLGSEAEHLEMISSSQAKELDQAQLALHLVKEEIAQAQAEVEEKNRVFSKGIWISTLEDVWKKAVLVSVSAHKNFHESKFLKHLEVLMVQFWTYEQRAQKVVEEEAHSAWESCKAFLSGPVKNFGLQLGQPNSILQPYLSRLNLYVSKGLMYGISQHLQLQRKIRKLLLRNKYLASKESREVVWFLASALLILPLYGVLLLSSFLGKRRRPLVTRTTPRYRRRQAVQWRHEGRRHLMMTSLMLQAY